LGNHTHIIEGAFLGKQEGKSLLLVDEKRRYSCNLLDIRNIFGPFSSNPGFLRRILLEAHEEER